MTLRLSDACIVQLPADSTLITDAEEEVFLLYTNLQTSSGSSSRTGLGQVDSHKDTLTVQFELKPESSTSVPIAPTRKLKGHKKHAKGAQDPVTIEVELAQDKTALNSRKGDTGSVLWRTSIEFAKLVLQQHHVRLEASLLKVSALRTAHVLELGAGTGLLSIVLSPLVSRYTVTDIPALLPLIRKNLALNFDGWPRGSNVSVEELDWQVLQSTSLPLRQRNYNFNDPNPIDLILVCDCIYHPSLLSSLVDTLDFLAVPDKTAVLVVAELRSEDVIRQFLGLWIARDGWDIWRVGSEAMEALGMPFVVWMGWRRS